MSLPILGALADFSGRKKELLAVFAYLGAVLTAGLYFLQGTNYLLGGILYVLANLSYGASVVCANAFLPQIASPDQRDTVSSQSWALGALGGGLLLAMNLALLTQASSFGLTEDEAVRIGFASAGVWWALFAVIPHSLFLQGQVLWTDFLYFLTALLTVCVIYALVIVLSGGSYSFRLLEVPSSLFSWWSRRTP